ncbi:hypothetical protein CMV_008622 [Castanea mollissima]|uniref:Cysteine-rich receptor-like protein kinase 25 n=1 Tax=Castanea mollissima TaxID=60419 RepID=A0A8J4RG36_9ROSI|nr:hypothetical protein CMV_008622 [Castanea mollissima]
MGVPSIKFCMTLLVLSLLISFLSQSRTEAVPTYTSHSCGNAPSFTVNTPYQSNLNQLLAYLSSNATRNIEFYNATASAMGSADTVYGLFICRGDMSADVCRDCVAKATKDIVIRCPVQKAAVVWYEECMVRYSYRYIFSSMATDPSAFPRSTLNMSEPDRFNQLVRATMNDLASQLSNVRAGAKKFGTKEATFTPFKFLYTLAQCTPDLTGADCHRCLVTAINTLPGCCGGKQMGSVLFLSCIVKYAVTPFYQSANTLAPTPPQDQVPGSTISPKGKSQISLQTIVVVVASISVSALLFVAGYCYLRRKQRKKYNVIQEENESLHFDFATIEGATDKFSDDNKLGEGGFGVVYKGILPNGQEIAEKKKYLFTNLCPTKALTTFYMILKDENNWIDFGMAKIFGINQTQGNTNRIVGTFGYMSPEYAMFGQFSLKSDVYSFGVLILEILTGEKNSSFCQANSSEDLLSYAWKHWRDETPLELLDPTLGDSYTKNEVIRSLHIGLHCVQDNPADRPTMATVVLMLNNDSVTLPLPQRPAYFFRSRTEDNRRSNEPESNQSTSKSISYSANEVSITELYPR